MTLWLRPLGQGNHSPLVLTYVERLRGEQPTPLQVKKGSVWVVNGIAYRVSKVLP